MDLKSFTQAIQQLADEKGISREKVLESIEMALAAAYKRDYGKRGQIIRALLNPETGQVAIRQIKIVVEEGMLRTEDEDAASIGDEAAAPAALPDADDEETAVGEKKIRFNPERHLLIEEARRIKADAKVGDEIEFPLEYPAGAEHGRIAAQTAKQVILQRIREAEREAVFEEYKDREGEVVSGLVQRIEGRNVFLDIGRTAGALPLEEQVPGERYRIGERLKVVITLVEKSPRGSGIFLSRSHPRLLEGLFGLEVPEVASGVVVIKAVAREPGSRSKVAVASLDPAVDPVGSLVGQKGVRVSTVIQELGGEKIDIIEWSDNPREFIAHALSPAKVIRVDTNEERRDAKVEVPEEQLSLAIGKRGQNVRLAAKLTGWRIDVRAPADIAKAEVETQSPAAEAASEVEIEPRDAMAEAAEKIEPEAQPSGQ